ncbi:FkbM family methyltransferase [Planctomycetaceae bacterium SH139]
MLLLSAVKTTVKRTLKRCLPGNVLAAGRVAWYLAREKPKELTRILRLINLGQVCEALANYEGSQKENGIEFKLRLYKSHKPLILRNGTSDFNMFRQVLIDQQYEVELSGPVEYIVDAGANAGFSSFFFLNRYPNARVIAIEPDPENFEVARRNLEPYSDRCHLLLAGIWGSEGTLNVHRTAAGSGRISHCSTQTLPGEPDDNLAVPARTIQSLMEEFQFPRIDYLKIDIEGAELSLFRDGDISFLQRTNFCAIECHGDECLAIFSRAAKSEEFMLKESGELTFAMRQTALPLA